MLNSLRFSFLNKLNRNNNVNNSQTTRKDNEAPTLNTLKKDTVSFGNNNQNPVTETGAVDGNEKELLSAKTKLYTYADDLVKNKLQLKPDQPLKITADKEFLPIVEIVQEQAYKMGSGNVIIDLKDPIIDDLNEKYGQKPNTEWKQLRDKTLEEKSAASIDFNTENSPYKSASLTASEQNAVINSNKVIIPPDVAKKLELDPKDILEGMLSLKKVSRL